MTRYKSEFFGVWRCLDIESMYACKAGNTLKETDWKVQLIYLYLSKMHN